MVKHKIIALDGQRVSARSNIFFDENILQEINSILYTHVVIYWYFLE